MSDETTSNSNNNEGLSRRDALKRGAAIGAAVWVAPAVTATPAFANGSGQGPDCEQVLYMKLDEVTGIAYLTGDFPGGGKFFCNPIPDSGLGPVYDGWNPSAEGVTWMQDGTKNGQPCYKVTLPTGWYFLYSSHKTGQEGGGDDPSCVPHAGSGTNSQRFCVPDSGDQRAISNVQMLVCADPPITGVSEIPAVSGSITTDEV